MQNHGEVIVVVGEQRGDEGKGRFVDMVAEECDIVARFNGGNNAGHTVVLPDGRELKLHGMPSGIAHPHVMNVIGNGTLVNPVKLVEEIETIKAQGIAVSADNLMISSAAHLTLPSHISDDEIREAGQGGQGSTKSGIAQVAAAKYLRTGARAELIIDRSDELVRMIRDGIAGHKQIREELGLPPVDEQATIEEYMECAHVLGGYVTDTVLYLNEQLQAGKQVLAEGAQAFQLDIDHGMYPYTTSSSTTSGGVPTGLGIPPHYISRVLGVSKAIQSHVGGGPFVTEVTDEALLRQLHGDMHTVDAERGTTTGRTRRLGYLDLPGIRRSQMVNGTTEMALTKLDWVPRQGPKAQICVAYSYMGQPLSIAPDAAYKLEAAKPVYESLPTWDEDIQGIRKFADLPTNAQEYVRFIEAKTGVPVTMIGVGPRRDQVIVR